MGGVGVSVASLGGCGVSGFFRVPLFGNHHQETVGRKREIVLSIGTATIGICQPRTSFF